MATKTPAERIRYCAVLLSRSLYLLFLCKCSEICVLQSHCLPICIFTFLAFCPNASILVFIFLHFIDNIYCIFILSQNLVTLKYPKIQEKVFFSYNITIIYLHLVSSLKVEKIKISGNNSIHWDKLAGKPKITNLIMKCVYIRHI